MPQKDHKNGNRSDLTPPCMRKMAKFLNRRDQYGKDILLNHDGQNDKITTAIGGFFTIMLYILLTLYLVQQYDIMNDRKE